MVSKFPCIVALTVLSLALHSEAITERPPSVPLGAEWLNSMPKGAPDFYPPTTQPVKQVEYKGCKKGVNVVEYLYAEVRQNNLGRGTDTNKAIRDWVKTIGKPKDDAGHIVGKNQGGLGTVEWNIFPQSSNFNRGVYAQDVEKMVNSMGKTGVVKIWFHFVFGDPTLPCRPTRFEYYILSSTGIGVNNDLLNP